MPWPLGSYSPRAKFAFPRSYVRGILFNLDGYTIQHFDNAYLWTKISDPSETWRIELDERFYTWSSDRWTLDYVVTSFTLHACNICPIVDQPFTLRWWTHPANKSPYLMFRFADVAFTTYTPFDFPAAPAGYWRPRFPNN